MMRALPVLTLALAAGCVTARTHSLPTGFVHVESGPYSGRAMSADGIVVGWRWFDNDPQSTVEFWAKVLRKELEGSRGYVHETSEAVGSAHAMLFAAQGESFYVALIVTSWTICVLEAAGPRADLARELPAIRTFVESLKPS
jgi:hypothetical protein